MLKQKQLSNDPRQAFNAYSDFAYGTGDFSLSSSGGGSSATVTSNPYPGRIGVARCLSGTTATGFSRIGLSSSTNLVTFGIGHWYYRTSVQVPVLATATDAYTMAIGFIQQTNFAAGYLALRYSERSPNFEIAIRVSASPQEVVFNTEIQVNVNTWYAIEISVNSTATQLEVIINGISFKIPITLSSLPTTLLNFGQYIQNTAGTIATRGMAADYCQCCCFFANPR